MMYCPAMRIANFRSSLVRHRAVHSRTCSVACRSLASSSGAPSPADLVSWVVQQGGKVEGVTVARTGGSGWGLQSCADVSPGTKVIDLPARCHLTYSAADDAKLLKLIDEVPSELWGGKLALQLLSHRLQGEGSSLSTYVANLPIGFSGIPMFFPREAIAAIEYPPVAEQVKKRCKWLYDFSQAKLAKLPGSPADPFLGTTVDINALGWALACVTSRAFRTRGPQHPASCLPLIDMANHSFEPNVEVRPTDAGIGLYAKQKLSAGEPLLLSYGPLSNDFLFMDYGFIIPGNPHDRVQLRFGVELVQAGAMVANVEVDGEPLELKPAAWQLKLLTELKLEGPGANTEVTFGGPQHLDPRLLAAARVLMAQSQEEVQGRTLERLGQLDQPVNRRNERCALRALSGVAAYSLSRFTTTTDQDEEMLVSGMLLQPAPPAQGQASPPAAASAVPLTDEMRLAIRFRMEKKRILSAAIHTMGKQLQGLSKATVSETSTAPRKGQAPLAATGKGFGKQGK